MLLRNESRIKHSIEIKLVFDDGKQRELEIHECDYIQVSYRKNGCLRCGVGIIRDIKPYVYTKRFPFCKRESAVITLDMSEDHVSCVDKIDMYDIIDIRILQSYDSDNDSEQEVIDPDFTVKKACCSVGCPVTNKGVICS